MVTLNDGRAFMLVHNGRGEIYDPKSGTWAFTQPGGPAAGVNMVVLDDGRVLTPFSYYSPTTGRWTAVPRTLPATHVAENENLTLLTDGRVLLTGGHAYGVDPLIRDWVDYPTRYNDSLSFIFDPRSNSWSAAGALSPSGHTAIRLQDDRVLLAGGVCDYTFNEEAADRCTDFGTCAPSAPYSCSFVGCYECAPKTAASPTGSKALGDSCAVREECASAHCADGVCCDNACTGCNACRTELKQNGGPNGTCGIAKDDTDPHEFCPRSVFDCSGRTGTCGGDGQCKLKNPAGAPCGETTCQSSTSFAGKVCNAAGECVDGTGSCAPFACANGVCSVCCGSASDCAPGLVCKHCDCIQPLTLGETCSMSEQCATGACVDGRCSAPDAGSKDAAADAELDATVDSPTDAGTDAALDSGSIRDSSSDVVSDSETGADASSPNSARHDDGDDDSGCACAVTAPSRTSENLYGWLAVLAALSWFRRQRATTARRR